MDSRQYNDAAELGDSMRSGEFDRTESIIRDVLRDPDALEILREGNRLAGSNPCERLTREGNTIILHDYCDQRGTYNEGQLGSYTQGTTAPFSYPFSNPRLYPMPYPGPSSMALEMIMRDLRGY
jgi:hypothetical protein